MPVYDKQRRHNDLCKGRESRGVKKTCARDEKRWYFS